MPTADLTCLSSDPLFLLSNTNACLLKKHHFKKPSFLTHTDTPFSSFWLIKVLMYIFYWWILGENRSQSCSVFMAATTCAPYPVQPACINPLLGVTELEKDSESCKGQSRWPRKSKMMGSCKCFTNTMFYTGAHSQAHRNSYHLHSVPQSTQTSPRDRFFPLCQRGGNWAMERLRSAQGHHG